MAAGRAESRRPSPSVYRPSYRWHPFRHPSHPRDDLGQGSRSLHSKVLAQLGAQTDLDRSSIREVGARFRPNVAFSLLKRRLVASATERASLRSVVDYRIAAGVVKKMSGPNAAHHPFDFTVRY